MTQAEAGWAYPFHQIAAAADQGMNALQQVTTWLSRNVVADDVLPREDPPRELAPAIESLRAALENIRRARSDAFERFVTGPLERFVRGFELTAEQYYLLGAMGAIRGTAKDLGLSPVDDFEAFALLHYEDNDWEGYINPSLQPRVPGSDKAGLRFGRSPEELPRARLRPEQSEFFRRYLPEVFARFRED
ncbi:MAG TPA: hypothetical protein VFW98_04930 [Gemmatimonadaceae bacterium]|nr:hypothetical protein [Gemmatimonadaceae bacterium]